MSEYFNAYEHEFGEWERVGERERVSERKRERTGPTRGASQSIKMLLKES